jgi:outer membrane protein OmpA-like peptidoglycan-associated protein
MISYGVESLLAPGDNYVSPFGLTHDILFGYRFGDVSKEDGGMDKFNDLIKGMEEQMAKTNARLDSTNKAIDARIAALENKPEVADNTKALEGRITTINGRLNQADQKIADLEKRPAVTTREVIREGAASTSNYPISGGSTGFGNAQKVQTVYFSVNSAVLDAKAKAILKTVASSLAAAGNTTVYLNGTASQEGNNATNMVLSMQRAASVTAYLKKMGVTQTILSTSAGDAASKAAVRKDRSVEIFTLGN